MWFIDAGVRKNGSIIIGIDDSTDGIPSMLFIPFANAYLYVRETFMSESVNGV